MPRTALPIHTAPPKNVRTSRFVIEKMDCPVEERLIRNKLEGGEGILRLDFDLMARELAVQHTLPSTDKIVSALNAIGMAPKEIEETAPTNPATIARTGASRNALKKGWLLLGISGVAALAAEVASWITGIEKSPLIAGLALLSIVTGGLPTLKKGWIALKTLTLNINFLMSVAVIGAIAIGQWPEAAMVIFLFAVAEEIEAMSLDRARNAIRTLMSIAPETAFVKNPQGDTSEWREVGASHVKPDDIVRVRPGERIPLDGVVTVGQSMVNQAPITGESLPVAKTVGDTVFAGTINENGMLEVRVTGDYQHTTLSRIVSAVQAAQAQRAPTQRFVDQFARYYTPIVVCLALLIAIIPPLTMGLEWSAWIYKALVLLVIACPCALVVSTPVTVVSGLAAAARHGILIKGGVYLEQGRNLKTIAFDKTGTVTHGKPEVTDILLLQSQGYSKEEVLRLAASVDDHDNHPVARAIVQRWKELGATHAPLSSVKHFESLTGKGVRGEIDGVQYYVGNHRLAEELGVCTPHIEGQLRTLENDGKTAVILIAGNTPIAIFGLADTPRETSQEALAKLHALGVRSVMLTGDNDITAQAIAKALGIDDARGNLLPQDKLSVVQELQRLGPVGMVGDGINDAPALAAAQIGFAMGAAGTDTALETADVALMDDDLRKLPDFIRISRSTSRILTQNIAFALGIKLVFFGLALAGNATLWMAVFADMGASLLVVFNGMRLLRMFKASR
jgi:Cd2+/Zn2+-exporting ATPase